MEESTDLLGAGTGSALGSEERGRESSREFSGTVRKKTLSILESRKRHLASEIDGFAGLIEDISRRMEERGQGGQKQYADRAAQLTRGFSRTLREHRADELIDRARREMEARPAVIMGGGLLLGFLGYRLLKE